MNINCAILVFVIHCDSLIERQELGKTAAAVAQEPWALHRAKAWLQQLVQQNLANTEHAPQQLQFIFKAEVCERLSLGIMPELSSVGYQFALALPPRG